MTLVYDYPVGPRSCSILTTDARTNLKSNSDLEKLRKCPEESCGSCTSDSDCKQDIGSRTVNASGFHEADSHCNVKSASPKSESHKVNHCHAIGKLCDPRINGDNRLAPVHMKSGSRSDKDIDHQKQKGTKRKMVDQSLCRLKFHKTEEMESGARTCRSDLVPFTKPCTRSRIQCS